MKKTILTLFASGLFAQLLFAQTNVINTTGNVGIGSLSPGNSLGFHNVDSDSGTSGITWYNPDPLSYGIYKTAGTWGGPNYQQLQLQWATGIILNPGNALAKSYVEINGGGLRVTNGNVGIGTTSPQTNAHIVGSGTSIDAISGFTGGGLIVQANTGSRSTTTGAQLEFVVPANTDGTNLWGQGRIITVAGNNTNLNATGEMILGTRRSFNKLGTGNQWYYGNDLTIDGNGGIGINTTYIPSGYQLAVNGSALATSITVMIRSSWPDFVFKKSYRLPSLTDIKTYIDQNHHLPEIPSATQVAKDGINLGEMNKVLVKKVEELTLYLIEKDKTEKEQKQVITAQSAQLKSQQEQINQLKQQLKTITKLLTKK